ncbi:adenosylcobinamide-phosphate synthase [Anaerolineales bacterium]|nr:adenosylcobinamide-phosphate synthase [Anaerolineales bacterium]
MPLLAILFDLLLGDPPNRFHPTAWMGNFIAFLMRFRPHGNRFAELTYGVFILLVGITLSVLAGLAITNLISRITNHQLLITILTALFLKLTISLRGLDRAAREVQSALEAGNLSEARRLLSWHLVSRDTSQLDESKVSAAAIESVAENASDGIIAPLFFFALGGLPAAFAYRFVNTADSMLGYHDEEREWLGKVPARLDDLLNFIPARLAGLFIVLSAPFCGASLSQAWKIMWRDSNQTASPNAGIPMSAMAGALDVELEKINHYALGKGLRLPTSADLTRARRLLYFSVTFAALSFFILHPLSFILSP